MDQLKKKLNPIKENKKKHLKIISLTFALILITSTLGCIQETEGQKNEKVTDMLGREVEVPEEVNKVVGVGPGSLRMIAYLNATEKVVGVEKSETSWGKTNPYNIAHPELRNKSIIGPHHGGDAELITEQKPELIIGAGMTSEEANDLQEKTDIPVFMLVQSREHLLNTEDFFNTLEKMGTILNKEERANKLIDYTEKITKDLNDRTKNIKESEKPSVYIGGRSHSGGAGLLSTQQPFTPFKLVNAKNVAKSIDGHKMISREKLIEWNPDKIFISGSNLDPSIKELKTTKYENLNALKNNEIYVLHPTVFYGSNFGTILANSYYVGTSVYPEQFEDINPEQKANEIYNNYVGEKIFNQVDSKFTGFEKATIQE